MISTELSNVREGSNCGEKSEETQNLRDNHLADPSPRQLYWKKTARRSNCKSRMEMGLSEYEVVRMGKRTHKNKIVCMPGV